MRALGCVKGTGAVGGAHFPHFPDLIFFSLIFSFLAGLSFVGPRCLSARSMLLLPHRTAALPCSISALSPVPWVGPDPYSESEWLDLKRVCGRGALLLPRSVSPASWNSQASSSLATPCPCAGLPCPALFCAEPHAHAHALLFLFPLALVPPLTPPVGSCHRHPHRQTARPTRSLQIQHTLAASARRHTYNVLTYTITHTHTLAPTTQPRLLHACSAPFTSILPISSISPALVNEWHSFISSHLGGLSPFVLSRLLCSASPTVVVTADLSAACTGRSCVNNTY